MSSRCASWSARSRPGMGKTFQCRLPSPTWPKQLTRNAPIRATRAGASAMKAGIAASGTEMSWLDTAPTARLPRGIDSRTSQKAARCPSDCATTPSETSPASSPAAKSPSRAACGSPEAPSPRSASTDQSGRPSGRRTCGRCSARKSSPVRPINSKAETASPIRARARFRSASAASGSRTTIIAAPVRAGRGLSFSVAAVMTPRVPSAPISRWRRSYPVLSLRRGDSPRRTEPSGSTASSPRQRSRALP